MRGASSVVERRLWAVGIGLGIVAPLLLLVGLTWVFDANGTLRLSALVLLAVVVAAAIIDRAVMLWRDAGLLSRHRVPGEPPDAALLRRELAAALRHAQYGAQAGLISIVYAPGEDGETDPSLDARVHAWIRSNVRQGDCIVSWAPSQIVVLQKLVRSHHECQALVARLTGILAEHRGHAAIPDRVRVVISLVGMVEHMRDLATCVQGIGSARTVALDGLTFEPHNDPHEALILGHEARLSHAGRDLRDAMMRVCRGALRLPAHVRVVVRLSARHLAEPDSPAHIEAALRDSGLAAGCLELTLDHATFKDLPPGAKVAFAALRSYGVRLCLENVVLTDATLDALHDVDAISLTFEAGETRACTQADCDGRNCRRLASAACGSATGASPGCCTSSR